MAAWRCWVCRKRFDSDEDFAEHKRKCGGER